MADMEIHLVDDRAEAHFKGITVQTSSKGTPTPFDLFIASLSTCAALTAAEYCRSRELEYEGTRILVDVERDPKTKLASSISMELLLPPGFPEEHRERIARVANACFVKKHLYQQPEFHFVAKTAD